MMRRPTSARILGLVALVAISGCASAPGSCPDAPNRRDADALTALAAENPFVARYRSVGVFGSHGFVATPTCTTCWSSSDELGPDGVVLDGGCGVIEIPLQRGTWPMNREELSEQIRAAVAAFGPRESRDAGCRGDLTALGDAFLAQDRRAPRAIVMSDANLEVLQSVMSAPGSLGLERARSWVAPRPPFVAEDVVGLVRIGVESHWSALSGSAHAPPLSEELQRLVEQLARAPAERAPAFDAPVVDLDVFIAGERVRQIETEPTPAELVARLERFERIEGTLWWIFLRTCTGPLLHDRLPE